MQRERSYFFLLKVMGRVSQNYSRGKHSPSFTGKSNHSKQGAGEGKNSAAEEEVSSVVKSWEKEVGGGRCGWWVKEESVSVTLFYLMLQVTH